MSADTTTRDLSDPQERLREIRARLKYAHDSTSDHRSDLTTVTITEEMDEMFAHAAGDILYLLAIAELARAMPEPVYADSRYAECVMCEANAYGDWGHNLAAVKHAPDCPWFVLRQALDALSGPVV